MKHKKALSPNLERMSKFETESVSNSLRDHEPSQRLGRENLKLFLSSELLKIPQTLRKKDSELNGNELVLPSPRPGQSFSSPANIKLPATSKFFGNIMAIKKANKNILNAFFNPKTQMNEQGQSPVRLSIVDSFKAFHTEANNEQNNFLNLTQWFDTNIRNTALFKYIEKDFCLKEKNIRDFLLINTEKFLNGSIERLLDLVKSRNSETFQLINKIFLNYQKYWGIVLVNEKLNQENTIQALTKELEKQKSDFSNLAKKAKQKILTVTSKQLKKHLNDKIGEVAEKDSELERLISMAIKDNKEKTSFEDYEKLIKNLKSKVADILKNLQPTSSKSNLNNSTLVKSILSEFSHLENFKTQFLTKNIKGSEPSAQGDSRITSCQSAQTVIETCDKETMLNFVYFNAETQTYYISSDNQSQQAGQEIEEEIRTLQMAGYIPAGAEIASWSAGYYTGLAHGKTIAQNEVLQAEELQENQNLDDSIFLSEEEDSPKVTKREKSLQKAIKNYEESLLEEPNSDFHLNSEEEHQRDNEKKETLIKRIDRKKKTTITKFKEFNFQKREKIVVQKKVKSKKVLNYIMKKSIHDLEKRKKMSKKMLVKIINTFYFALIKLEDVPDNLLEYVYSDFETKNSLKKVVYRKVVDFLANLIQNSSILKIKTFIKFLRLEKRIKEPGLIFPKDSLSLYLSGFDSIFKSKLGFMPDFNDFSETNLVPVVRVSEFYKEKLSENLSPSKMSKLFEFIEKNSTFDKKRLNKSGVIEIESALDFAINVYEEHLLKVKMNGELLIKALTCSNLPEAISKDDLVFVAGLFRPGRVFKDLEAFSGEFISCEEIFAGNLKEVFPEELADGGPVGFEEVLKGLEGCEFFNENGYTELFRENGKELNGNVLSCVYQILELYNKSSL